jgi:hypothetical protein
VTPRANRYPCPALRAWRAELAAGQRTRTTFDPLFWAAAAEQSGLDALADGLPEAAARDFARAAETLERAAA